MNITKFSRQRGLAAPKRSRAAGLGASKPRGEGGFTILEIMIVVSIITILSFLAMIAINKVRDRAVRSLIANNLRQFYNAKEYYFSESGSDKAASIIGLERAGFVTPRLRAAMMARTSMEASQGWHYDIVTAPGEPTLAYKGVKFGTTTTGEAIHYPEAGEANSTTQITQTSTPVPAAVSASKYLTGTGAVVPPAMVANMFRQGLINPDGSISASGAISGLKIATAAAGTSATQPVQPAKLGPVAGPPGSPVLRTGTPSREWMDSQHEIYRDDAWWLQAIGAISPDGSPATVISVKSDPPSFITDRGRHSSGDYSVDITHPGATGQATLYVTIKNGSGTSTLPFILKTGP